MKPWEHFDKEADFDEILTEHGWEAFGGITQVDGDDTQLYTRPGKDTGSSARLFIDKKLLHVFTSSAEPLEAGGTYMPSAFIAMVEHGGDFSAAGRAFVHQGYGTTEEPLNGWVPFEEFERGLEAHKRPGPLMRCVADLETAAIPPRDWLMRSRFVPKFVTLTIAPGGGSKSTLSTLEAISVATGQALTGMEVLKPGPVWLYNSEDPTDEMERKIAACCIAHDIVPRTLRNVFYRSGQDEAAFVFVKMDPAQGLMVNQRLVDEVARSIRAAGIVLFVLDPFVGTHRVNENDNMQIEAVLTVLRRIANATGCAVHIVHHTRKLGKEGGVGDAETARGASSNVSASRVTHTLNVMTEKEAKSYGIPEGRAAFYVRLDDAKNNFSGPGKATVWFERSGVLIANGKDEVGVLKLASLEKLEAVRLENTEQIITERILETITNQEQEGARPWSLSAFAEQHATVWKEDILGVSESKITKCAKLLVTNGILRQSKERLPGSIRSIEYLRLT